ncbi:rCG44272 [Rattus norvegicus]|uniref:RCG44272 n=1 Tax=Rattus norvegicus TaxID=10116 RepID=A6KD92_RAT|nr:rCG44272 [Rattus norvegicus]
MVASVERNDRRTNLGSRTKRHFPVPKSVSRETGSTRPRPRDVAPPPQFPVLTARNPQRRPE